MRLKTGLGILAVAGTLVASPVFAAELKIGVVDYGRLVEESPQAKSALETIRTEFWRDGDVVSFRASVPDRNVVVMNNGRAEVTL